MEVQWPKLRPMALVLALALMELNILKVLSVNEVLVLLLVRALEVAKVALDRPRHLSPRSRSRQLV